jgi:deoxyribodipyrimidine photo-lyase
MAHTVIHWFRQDLRLSDNPALKEAASRGRVLPLYILDDENAGDYAMGAASRWWLHRSLQKLSAALDGKLAIYRGDARDVIASLVSKHNVKGVYWNRCYEPWRIERDSAIKEKLKIDGLDVETFNGSLLWEPWETVKDDGSPYRVFSPFFHRGCNKAHPPREPLNRPSSPEFFEAGGDDGLEALDLLPDVPWYESLEENWSPGEKGAEERLSDFLEEGLGDYKEGRNFPAKQNVSRLSPHLHFGEISPNQVWYAARECEEGRDLKHFLSELGWREFSHSQLYFNPDLPHRNLQGKFDDFPWRDDADALERWQKGMTGYPIVDAGMRELWQTGYMHNRVRMVVGSFLVKNLLLHWRDGERWFWDTLADADLANNSASWQWVAGCGADAAPYFRIFNPVTQGQKFDPNGRYTRRYVPELKNLPDKYLFNPWEAPESVLEGAGIKLGSDYPQPMVDLKASRERALGAFKSLKK